MIGPKLLDYLNLAREPMLAELRELVEHESPSRDKPALDLLATTLATRLHNLGGDEQIVANTSGGNHVLVRFSGRSNAEKPILVLGHFDTVWPLGTTQMRPFRVQENQAFGPGSYDMKASLVIVFWAIQAIRDLERVPHRPIVVLFTSDEEIGSPTSRKLIETHAKTCESVLVIEPPLANGGLKTSRKGVGLFSVEVTGRTAHAGVEPENGVNAILELSHQIVKIHELADRDAGTTVSAGVISGGTTPNVVPAWASVRVDVRARTQAEAGRIDRAIRSLKPVLTGASLTITGGFNRPPMERTTAIATLYDRVRAIGQSLDLDLAEGSTGGGSDANFTAALGIATIDGLGARGAGAHSETEHILVDSLAERAALLACLLLEL